MRGPNRFTWKTGSKLNLYALDFISKFETKFICLVEGESDAQTLLFNGFPALGIPGAGCWNEERDASHLEPFSEIFVVIEPDQGGESMREFYRHRLRDRFLE